MRFWRLAMAVILAVTMGKPSSAHPFLDSGHRPVLEVMAMQAFNPRSVYMPLLWSRFQSGFRRRALLGFVPLMLLVAGHMPVHAQIPTNGNRPAVSVLPNDDTRKRVEKDLAQFKFDYEYLRILAREVSDNQAAGKVRYHAAEVLVRANAPQGVQALIDAVRYQAHLLQGNEYITQGFATDHSVEEARIRGMIFQQDWEGLQKIGVSTLPYLLQVLQHFNWDKNPDPVVSQSILNEFVVALDHWFSHNMAHITVAMFSFLLFTSYELWKKIRSNSQTPTKPQETHPAEPSGYERTKIEVLSTFTLPDLKSYLKYTEKNESALIDQVKDSNVVVIDFRRVPMMRWRLAAAVISVFAAAYVWPSFLPLVFHLLHPGYEKGFLALMTICLGIFQANWVIPKLTTWLHEDAHSRVAGDRSRFFSFHGEGVTFWSNSPNPVKRAFVSIAGPLVELAVVPVLFLFLAAPVDLGETGTAHVWMLPTVLLTANMVYMTCDALVSGWQNLFAPLRKAVTGASAGLDGAKLRTHWKQMTRTQKWGFGTVMAGVGVLFSVGPWLMMSAPMLYRFYVIAAWLGVFIAPWPFVFILLVMGVDLFNGATFEKAKANIRQRSQDENSLSQRSVLRLNRLAA